MKKNRRFERENREISRKSHPIVLYKCVRRLKEQE